MSLHPQPMTPVPEQTARVAHAAFPKGHPYLTLRDHLGTIFQDEDFATLFPAWGYPGLPPWRLALVTIMQFRENLADRQAAEAVRARIDWKYLLSLELTDPGFDFSVLSEFRDRLLAGSAEALLLEKLLERCRTMGLLKARGQQRTDSTHVLAAIRVMNRLELVAETLRAALNALAAVAPAWLQAMAPLAWYERYGKRIEDTRLPQGQASRDAYGQMVGEDGFTLLDALEAPETPESLRALPVITTLRQTWQRHYERASGKGTAQSPLASSSVHFKRNQDLPPAAEAIESPYDPEARYRQKCDTPWTGYMVHISETCEPTAPHLLTHVHTTTAAVYEAQCTTPIHQALSAKDLAPREHFVDGAYISADELVASQEEHGITLRGPTRPIQGWQAHTDGAYDLSQFTVDWEQRQARCPQGKVSTVWREYVDREGQPYTIVRFGLQDCRPCPARPLCSRTQETGRSLHLPSQERFAALQAARAWYASEETGGSSITAVRGSKGRSHKGCGPLACGAPGFGAWRRPTYSTSRSRPRSISTGLWRGSTSARGPRHAPRALRHWRLCTTSLQRPPRSEQCTYSSP
jgi:transposase